MPSRVPQLHAGLLATPLLRGIAVVALALGLGGTAALASGGGGEPPPAASVSASADGDDSAATAAARAAPVPAARPRVASVPRSASPANSAAPAATAPALRIVSHEANAKVSERIVEFRGIAEPGSVVSSGSAVAAIGPYGHWELQLELKPGANLKTFEVLDPHGKRSRESVIVNYHPDESAVAAAKETLAGSAKSKDGGVHKVKDPDAHKAKDGASGAVGAGPKYATKAEQPPELRTKSGIKSTEFSASQKYGFCEEDPPYDVFSGTAAAGALISIASPYGSGTTVAGADGRWSVKVTFPTAPVATSFEVTATDGSNVRTFSFVHTP